MSIVSVSFQAIATSPGLWFLSVSLDSVYGLGNRTTPEPFVVACNRFVYVESLAASQEHRIEAEEIISPQERTPAAVKDADC